MEPTEHFGIYFGYIRRLFQSWVSPFKASTGRPFLKETPPLPQGCSLWRYFPDGSVSTWTTWNSIYTNTFRASSFRRIAIPTYLSSFCPNRFTTSPSVIPRKVQGRTHGGGARGPGPPLGPEKHYIFSLRKVDFSHPTGHYTYSEKKIAPPPLRKSWVRPCLGMPPRSLHDVKMTSCSYSRVLWAILSFSFPASPLASTWINASLFYTGVASIRNCHFKLRAKAGAYRHPTVTVSTQCAIRHWLLWWRHWFRERDSAPCVGGCCVWERWPLSWVTASSAAPPSCCDW